MKELEKEILEIIDSLLSKCRKEFKEDIKQDLLMFSYGLIKKPYFTKVENKVSYLFICLKNEAIRLNKKYVSDNCNVLSLDVLNPVTNLSYLEMISNPEEENYFIHAKEYHSIIEKTLVPKDYNLLCDFYLYDMKQKDLAKKYGISQQAISKRIKKIKEKIIQIIVCNNNVL